MGLLGVITDIAVDRWEQFALYISGLIRCHALLQLMPCGNVNGFVWSLLPELGTLGSIRGNRGDPLLYQLQGQDGSLH